MSTNLKKVLHNQGGLEITFLVDDGAARVEFRANEQYDLSDPDDVVVVVNGSPAAIDSAGADAATARIGPWDAFEGETVSLMIRVNEFFEGWEVEA